MVTQDGGGQTRNTCISTIVHGISKHLDNNEILMATSGGARVWTQGGAWEFCWGRHLYSRQRSCGAREKCEFEGAA